MRSLNRFLKLRRQVMNLRNAWLQRVRGVVVQPSTMVSLSARFVPGRHGAIRIGGETLVAFKTLLIARAPSGEVRPITVGNRCFVGGGSTILPGVTIGDQSIVGAGSVVFDDVPPRSIVAGNPARVIRSDIDVGIYGRLTEAYDRKRAMLAELEAQADNSGQR